MNIKKKLNSINFKTLSYLIVFSATILLLLWIFQILFLSIFYERYQINDLNRIANKIYSTKEENLSTYLDEISYEKNICIEYYYYNQNIAYNTRIPGCILVLRNTNIATIKNELISSDTNLNGKQILNPETNAKSLLFSVKVDNGYVFLNTTLEDINSTTMVLKSQLIYITLIAIILASLISFFISKKITSPILDIAKKAKDLGKTDKKINFKEYNISEIDELTSTLNDVQNELFKTENLRQDLMANVSHDLKTPLTMIKAYAELIRDYSYKKKSDREEHLNIIINETERLNILVNDILSLSKMQSETNAEVYHIDDYDLTEEIKEIIKRYAIIKETEDYQIIVDIPEKMFVHADKNKINQVLYNLVNNAINYTGKDKKVTIKGIEETDSYLIEIIDTGKGIKESDLNLIWDKYYKNEKNHKRNVVGTGLGLSIVKNILVFHQFDYGVKSTKNKGTTFYFRIKKIK